MFRLLPARGAAYVSIQALVANVEQLELLDKNSYMALRVPSTSLHRVILLERRLRLMRILYGN
jgi:hypothetical protein